jgi:dTMP kinase
VALARGLLISFEGGEGSGKSEQAKRLHRNLRSRGLPAVLTREPGGTRLGERVREILLHAPDVALTPEAQALLFTAARAQLVREVIRPALMGGTHVITDRFFDSTLAYQGYGHGTDLDALRALARVAVGDVVPDMTFLLDVPIEVSLARMRDRPTAWDRFESGGPEFHRRVRDGYLALAREEPGRIVVISGERTEDEIAQDIASRVAGAVDTRIRAVR